MRRALRKNEKFAETKNFYGDPEAAEAHRKKPPKLGEAQALYRRNCVKCGCPLGFGKTYEGKTIPLDLRAPVYCVTGEGGPNQDSGVVRTHMAFVSHFATCKFANEFSGSKKKKEPEVDPAPIGGEGTDDE